jgi:hypothetical protein
MSDLNVFADLFQLVWPLLSVFALIVSLKAKQRHPGQGSTLMVAGSLISMLVSFFHATLNYGMRFDWLDYENVGMYYSFTNVISLLGQVLFLVGLLTLINSIVTTDEAPMNKL